MYFRSEQKISYLMCRQAMKIVLRLQTSHHLSILLLPKLLLSYKNYQALKRIKKFFNLYMDFFYVRRSPMTLNVLKKFKKELGVEFYIWCH